MTYSNVSISRLQRQAESRWFSEYESQMEDVPEREFDIYDKNGKYIETLHYPIDSKWTEESLKMELVESETYDDSVSVVEV